MWGYIGTEVSLAILGDDVVTDFFAQSGEWMLVKTSVEKNSGGNYTADLIKFHIAMRRKPAFLIVNVILPIFLMAILNLLVFLLSTES